MYTLGTCCYSCGTDPKTVTVCSKSEQSGYCSIECAANDFSHISSDKSSSLTLQKVYNVAHTALNELQAKGSLPKNFMLALTIDAVDGKWENFEISVINPPKIGYYQNCTELYERAEKFTNLTKVRKVVIHVDLRDENPKGIFTTATMSPFLFSLI